MASTQPQGYDKLAVLMARDPGMAIYRRFAKLNAKNLLYLQAELSYVQADLDVLIEEDGKIPEKKEYPFSLWDLKNDEQCLQWKKVLEARKLLKEYNDALLQQAQLLRLRDPEPSDFEIFKEWMNRETVNTIGISPPCQWGGENETDLLALFNRHEGKDALTRWVFTKGIPWYHERWGVKDTNRQDAQTGAYFYDDKTIEWWTFLLGLIMWGSLAGSSVSFFFHLRDAMGKEAVLLVYNMIFVMSMTWMLKASCVEMFVIATAFTAEQVIMHLTV
ncbi:hypothetical protein BO94DRAFT_583304 [Aspergillus sclerotioniger CBS 115572]|uniref:DUF6594 domain-containing protein n=1 Tax=Aspergillus sclerotioniger CBS 115572 TaxID=1450535 RepID=A0A317X929_9EURO|nr:hypothetical protein BO94DRAFT_583304 [Aspergillus sclerotioniger CBS 115572]PWY93060.1 hypothetical protein BO94DRAFT_583304 [Aspergillus sclerotioniger CBS 115572]